MISENRTRPNIRRDCRRLYVLREKCFILAILALLFLCISFFSVSVFHRSQAEDYKKRYEQATAVKNTAMDACKEMQSYIRTLEVQLANKDEEVSRYDAITSAEREMIARLVYLEARGEPFDGQQAVAEVVLNRVAADNFPNSVESVIMATSPNGMKQFAPAELIPDTTPTETQYMAVDAALYGTSVLPSDVVYFSISGENSNVWGKIGTHTFCRQYDWSKP